MSMFYDLIKKRRSARKFTTTHLSVEALETLKKGVLMSPASKRNNPWEFVFIQNKQTIEQLADCKEHGSKFLASAPLAVIVCADPSKSDVWVEDCSISSIYLQLLAEDIGLGSCWIQVRERKTKDGIKSSDYIKQLLNIPSSYEVLSVIAIGEKEVENKPFDESKLQLDKIKEEKYQ